MKGVHPFQRRSGARKSRVNERARILEQHGIPWKEAKKIAEALDRIVGKVLSGKATS